MALLDEDKKAKPMPTCSNRSNPIHSFSLPTQKWTKRRRTRCMSAFAADAGSSGCSEKGRVIDSDDNDGIASMRENLILDLKTEVDRMKNAIFSNEKNKEDEEKAAMPWNLRKRSCSSVVRDDGAVSVTKKLKIDDKKQNRSPQTRPDGAVRLPQLRSSSEKMERVKFSIQLLKKEIAEDFMKMLGQKPPRKPNKRPRAVQNQLDTLFPGLSLMEVTADSYKVLEAAEKGKVRRSVKKKA
ncbi:hypothetical protein VNO77_39548 [Canavalia gladiata]|uniref:Uncharacterized protein n=1 Tax=Canavalia gladiata TaxID=3824 RepID=A0AAN9PQU9_CANGL